MKNAYAATLFGYVLVNTASNLFYHTLFLQSDGVPLVLSVLLGAYGLFTLARKHGRTGPRRRAVLTDLGFVLPVVLLPLLPVGHSLALGITTAYACLFVVVFAYRNYPGRTS